MNEAAYAWRDGHLTAWKATTLRALGKTERALEDLIADDPELLGLEPHRTGIRGPFVVVRRPHLETGSGREVVPDLLILTGSGHVLLVEARLGDSEDLRDRRAVAALLEYAAAFTRAEPGELLALVRGPRLASCWPELVADVFPREEHPAALADVIVRRLGAGGVHVFVVCDGAPPGLRELVEGVTGACALGDYEVHVTELTVHATPRGAPDGLLLLPRSPLRTAIVSRTAITVSYEPGQPRPAVAVAVAPQTTPLPDGARAPRPYYAGVLQAYERQAGELSQRLRIGGLQLRGAAPTFRQIRPEGWPAGIHYELLDRAEFVAVELHLESTAVLGVQPLLKALPARLFHKLPTLVWSDHWSKGKGKLALRSPCDRRPEEAARLMLSFIEHSVALIDRELCALGIRLCCGRHAAHDRRSPDHGPLP